MRAIIYDGTLRFRADEPVPVRRPGEVLIRVRLAGICNTDLEILRGYLGYQGIMGHEFVGEVVETDRPELLGQRVVGEINIPCGTCAMCRMGHPRHCERILCVGIRRRPGVMADYVVLPEDNVHVVPANVSDRQAVFTEPLAAGVEVLEQAHIKPSDRVVVLGDGKLGMLTAQAIHAHGYHVEVVGRHREKLAIAERMGMQGLLSGEFTGKADVVIECTGHPSGLVSALQMVRAKGTVVLKSTYSDAGEVNLSPLVVNEVTCIGSRCGPFPPALRLLAEGKIDTESLIEAEFSAGEALLAFERAAVKGSRKVLIRFAK